MLPLNICIFFEIHTRFYLRFFQKELYNLFISTNNTFEHLFLREWSRILISKNEVRNSFCFSKRMLFITKHSFGDVFLWNTTSKSKWMQWKKSDSASIQTEKNVILILKKQNTNAVSSFFSKWTLTSANSISGGVSSQRIV